MIRDFVHSCYIRKVQLQHLLCLCHTEWERTGRLTGEPKLFLSFTDDRQLRQIKCITQTETAAFHIHYVENLGIPGKYCPEDTCYSSCMTTHQFTSGFSSVTSIGSSLDQSVTDFSPCNYDIISSLFTAVKAKDDI